MQWINMQMTQKLCNKIRTEKRIKFVQKLKDEYLNSVFYAEPFQFKDTFLLDGNNTFAQFSL